jgi:hypothetical protein
VPEPNASEDVTDHIPAEPIQAGGGGILHFEIHKFIMLICNKEELPHQ